LWRNSISHCLFLCTHILELLQYTTEGIPYHICFCENIVLTVLSLQNMFSLLNSPFGGLWIRYLNRPSPIISLFWTWHLWHSHIWSHYFRILIFQIAMEPLNSHGLLC